MENVMLGCKGLKQVDCSRQVSQIRGVIGLAVAHYRWKTIQASLWDLVKGDCHCYIEVTTQ